MQQTYLPQQTAVI